MVPSLVYPFFSDQPVVAAKAIGLGVALPLVEDSHLARATADQVRRALDSFKMRRASMLESVAAAWEWERDTLELRREVAQRVLKVR